MLYGVCFVCDMVESFMNIYFCQLRQKKSPKLDFLQHSEVFGYFFLVHIFVHTFPQLGLVRIVEIEP